MPSGGKIENRRHTCSETERRIGQSIRVEYSEPLAAWIFPRQGTHGSYAVDECARMRFVYFSKNQGGRR